MEENWISRFTNTYNRPPRILHIGNIANNAYQISKLLNAAGAQSDVLCNDYYHCMGCPEWDDADYTGEIGDSFFPRWDKVDLHGFERPRWFAQGPLELCVKYLIAYRTGNTGKAARLWRRLQRSQKRQRAATPFVDKLYVYFRLVRRGLYFLVTDPVLFWVKFKNTLSKSYRADRLREWQEKPIEERYPQWAGILQKLRIDATKYFPDRVMEFGEDVLMYFGNLELYRGLFRHYDIVQGYATSPIIPYLTEFENYIAFEHGTIREIPYINDMQGQLTLLSYANAKAIYITNIDCYQDAKYFTQYSPASIVYGLHGLDIERIIRRVQSSALSYFNGRFGISESIPVFFSSSRHDLISGNKFCKGDEKVISAAALLQEAGYDFRLIFVEFGSNVQELKNLIAKYPTLESLVIWTPILDKEKLYKAFSSVDAILDQFSLRAFGGVTIEALAAGHALLISSSIDIDSLQLFFSAPPPYLGCYEVDEIYKAMLFVIEYPQKAYAIAREGTEWLRQFHASQQILEACCEALSYTLPA